MLSVRFRVAILEFATTVDGKQVEGIDKLTFDQDGKITELKVMLRPASVLRLVGAKMGEEFRRVGLPVPSYFRLHPRGSVRSAFENCDVLGGGVEHGSWLSARDRDQRPSYCGRARA